MKPTKLLVAAGPAAAASAIITGCNSNDRTKISAILDRPDRFVGRSVIVAGDITKIYGADPIAEAGAYEIDDGTGRIWIITRHGVPDKRSEVGVKGTVEREFRFGREVFATVIHEEGRKVLQDNRDPNYPRRIGNIP